MLRQPHIAPLAAFVAGLRCAHPGWEFSDFDPFDGGLNADLLFLLEKPGPMTSIAGGGSGFISRDNDNPTAEAIFRFMIEAGVPRERTVIWNIVPGWNGTLKVTTEELVTGTRDLKALLPLLPKVWTVVLVGRKAQRATSMVEALGLRVLVSAHPSPQVRASRPDIWRQIPLIWSQANSARSDWHRQKASEPSPSATHRLAVQPVMRESRQEPR